MYSIHIRFTTVLNTLKSFHSRIEAVFGIACTFQSRFKVPEYLFIHLLQSFFITQSFI